MATQRQTATRIGVVLLSLSGLLTLLAAVMAATGGFTIDLAGIPLKFHAVSRPVIAAVVLGLAGIATAGLRESHGELDRVRPWLHRHGLAIAIVFAALIGLGVYFGGAHIAGGADSSGYISEARLWRTARFTDLEKLRVATPLATELSLSNGQYAFTPVGYQPSGTTGFAVPGYPPGLPWHFAIVAAVLGERAQFVVMPICAAGIVLLSFVLGRKIGGDDCGLIAAACGGAAPIMLYQATQPMSDVVAAFWWTLAVVLLTTARLPHAAGAGIAAAIACSVRPNLFAVVPVLALLALWWQRFSVKTITRLLVFSAPIAVMALLFASLQRLLYGRAAQTGYGSLDGLFGWSHVLPNLLRYPQWAYYTQSALIVAAIAAPYVIRRGWVTPNIDRATAQRIAWSGLIFFCALQAFYLLYLSFEDWVYFRFLLPALPWVLALQATAITAVCVRVPSPLRGLVIVLLAVLTASWGVGRARGVGAFRLQDSEQRYLDVADFARGLPPNAVFISLQHSGSLAYNAGANVLRWDWVDPSELDAAVAGLEGKGHQVLAVLDDWEEIQFRERFTRTRTAAALTPVFSAGGPPAVTVRVYAVSAPTTSGASP